MKRRLEAYNKNNKSDDAEPSIANFFEEQETQGMEVFKQPIDSQDDLTKKVMNGAKIYIERNERPFNYMTYDEEEEKERFQAQMQKKQT